MTPPTFSDDALTAVDHHPATPVALVSAAKTVVRGFVKVHNVMDGFHDSVLPLGSACTTKAALSMVAQPIRVACGDSHGPGDAPKPCYLLRCTRDAQTCRSEQLPRPLVCRHVFGLPGARTLSACRPRPARSPCGSGAGCRRRSCNRVTPSSDNRYRYRTGFEGKSSPVQFFWGSFDLATTRYSGRPAPPRVWPTRWMAVRRPAGAGAGWLLAR